LRYYYNSANQILLSYKYSKIEELSQPASS
jgi:hypothetical protein